MARDLGTGGPTLLHQHTLPDDFLAREPMDTLPIRVNRASVLTRWTTVAAERLGYPPETALTVGRFVAFMRDEARSRRLF